jgi:hypothetical protein
MHSGFACCCRGAMDFFLSVAFLVSFPTHLFFNVDKTEDDDDDDDDTVWLFFRWYTIDRCIDRNIAASKEE